MKISQWIDAMKIMAGHSNLKRLYISIAIVLALMLLFSLLFPIFFRVAKVVSDDKPGLWGHSGWYVWLIVAVIVGWGFLTVVAILLVFRGNEEKLHKKYLLILVGVSLMRGVLCSAIIPPWQSPDEHAHFEYAALLGELGRIPTLHDLSDEMQSRIVSSMFRYNFWQLIKRQPVESPPEGFIIQSGIFEVPPTHVVNNRFLYYPQVEADPPLYYIVPALIYIGLIESDTALQLYGMRLATVTMFVVLIATVCWVLYKIFPDNPFIVMETATFVAFLPMLTYMGSVLNNDVLSVVFTTLLLGTLVFTIRFGLSWRRAFIIGGLLLVGLLTRYTSVWTIPLVMGTGLVYGYRKHRTLRYAVWIVGLGILIFLGTFLIPSGQTRHWNSVSSVGSTVTNRASFEGKYALYVKGTAAKAGILMQDLLTQSVLDLQGRQANLIAWVRADGNQQTGWLAIGQDGKVLTEAEFVADTRWQKIELQFDVSETAHSLQVMLGANDEMKVYFDAVTLVDFTASKSQTMIVRNGSAEQVSTLAEIILVRISEFVKFSKPVQRFFSTWQDNLRLLIHDPLPIKLGVQSFWGNFGAALLIPLNSSVYKVLNAICMIGAIGMVIFVYRTLAGKLLCQRWQIHSLLIFSMALLLVLFETLVPLLAMYGMWTPQGRYLFPVILPIATFCVLGWNQMIPLRMRKGLLLLLVLCVGLLDYTVLRILLSYFYTI